MWYRKLMNNYVLLTIILAGLILRLVYLNYTPFNERRWDAEDHIKYVEHIVRYNSLPSVEQYWEGWQQPLYYIIAAIFYKLFLYLKVQNIYLALQFFSLILSMGFLMFGILILKRLLQNHYLLILSSLLLVFWPSGIIHSVRISNDILFYLLFTIGLYFLVIYDQKETTIDLYLSSLFAVLTLLTKLHGALLIALISLIFLSKKLFRRNTTTIQQKKGWLIFILFFIGFFLAFSKKDAIGRFTNPSLNGLLYLENQPKNYLWLDVYTFINKAFVSAWENNGADFGGRQFFWNFLLKSSLFGEFQFNSPLLAQTISFFFLCMVIYSIAGLLILKFEDLKKNLIIFLSLGLWFASIFLLRIKYPASPYEDFRLIFPSIIPLVFLYTYILNNFKKMKLIVFEYLGIFFIFMFILSVNLFFLGPYL